LKFEGGSAGNVTCGWIVGGWGHTVNPAVNWQNSAVWPVTEIDVDVAMGEVADPGGALSLAQAGINGDLELTALHMDDDDGRTDKLVKSVFKLSQGEP
jgi:hypothetical protein